MLRQARRLAEWFSSQTQVYGVASKMGGSSADSLYQKYAGSYHNHPLRNMRANLTRRPDVLPGVTIVTSPEDCHRCLQLLMQTKTVVAWDTETMDLDIKQEAPVGKGSIICASFFGGPELDFGRGPRVFIDNFGDNAGLLDYFKPYLESEQHLKVWHNYGFDRHVFFNHGIDVRGFGGDTMHMARLLDSSKLFKKYSLAELTKDYATQIQIECEHIINKFKLELLRKRTSIEANGDKADLIQQQIDTLSRYPLTLNHKKEKMEMLFGRRRVLKSGGEGVSYEYPTTLTMHTSKEYLEKWVEYSVRDSEATFYLRAVLEKLLKKEKNDSLGNLWEFYKKRWLPLGEVLTQLQREGIRVDLQHMTRIEQQARDDLRIRKETFLSFLKTFQPGPNIDHFNPSSTLQLQQLLFAPCKVEPPAPPKKDNKEEVSREDREMEESCRESDLLEKEREAYEPKKLVRKEVDLSRELKTFKVDNLYSKNPKTVEMVVKGICLPFSLRTPTGLPAIDISVIQELAGQPRKGKYGTAFQRYKEANNEEFGRQLCEALQELVDYNTTETLLGTFIEPLKGYVDRNSRVHCSLNINTETGRLSARKPNLQNQPALDKDVYKIRKAFVAGPGKRLIVADYGQLELRVLAHLTNCAAMIRAFKEGGDFHSRTAIGMYEHVRKAIEGGEVLLEWDRSKGEPPVPLLKDKFAAERKKAKTVNFSIAYGKSARGFADDWGCSLDEARKVIDAWFSDRPEVQKWQEERQKEARRKMVTYTLLGRPRRLDKFFVGPDPGQRKVGMAMRRAINTPIQGGAADIVNASMVKIGRHTGLRQLGWKLLLQIHDELILEGPEESAQEALAIVKHEMQNPFDSPLLVALQVDAKIGLNWYDCK